MANLPGVGIGPTTDHTSARNEATAVAACGKPRRRWTVEQKRQIVAESLEPGASVATVAHKHGISSGQFYAWRQQLLLRGALGAGVDPAAISVRADVPSAPPFRETAHPAPPEPDLVSAPVAPPPSAQLEAGILLPSGLSAPLAADAAAKDAPMCNRRSVLNGPIAARTERGQAARPRDAAPDGAVGYALRCFCQGDRTGRSPVPGQQLFEFVLPGAAGDEAFQHVGKPGERLDAIQLRRVDQRHSNCPVPGTAVGSGEKGVLPCQCHHGAILPISTKRSRSIIAGTRCMAARSGSSTLSGDLAERLSSLRLNRVWRSSWRPGCSIPPFAQRCPSALRWSTLPAWPTLIGC